ncbi:hypothetical protein L226DRAFT_352909 [Lentinus tigrinus ALCF2SS1-7]|uniref:uncharacterized protein n=1 Tax=Lentinus tigrinus ALCF2SS1-7 TaxID=1328758 RepID=UPI00116622B2|nr:hypothetical protein L226DRAFT_352909 [Lentinus tigrinus ALCF2SS1-7]
MQASSVSFYSSTSMADVRIPPELCKLIIDSIRAPQPWYKRLVGPEQDVHGEMLLHFRACAAVCTEWLPRARRHLYHRIVFKRPSQVELLIRSLTDNPSLAELVRELVLSSREYIPFVHPTLINRLHHLHTLVCDLSTLGTTKGDWSYPPRYHLLITRFPLTELAIRYSLSSKAWIEMFRLIWSLRSLESLYLELYHAPELTDAELRCLTAICRPWACARLKTLVIEGHTMRRCTSCLPVGAFGASVERFSLSWRDGPVPAAVLAQVALWAELHELHVYERYYHSARKKDQVRVAVACPNTLAVLSQIPSPCMLRKITISVSVAPGRLAYRGRFLYGLSGWSNEPMDKLLVTFTKLQTLHFEMSESDGRNGRYDAAWWHRMLAKYCLQQLARVSLSVRVHEDPRASESWLNFEGMDDPRSPPSLIF